MAVAVISVAFVYERGCELASDYIWDSINKGKQWKEVKHLYGG